MSELLTPRRLVAIAAIALCAGCLDTHQGLRQRVSDKDVPRAVEPTKVGKLQYWQRVASGFKPKVSHVGYVRTERELRDEEMVEEFFYVYDREFVLRGFFTKNGVTMVRRVRANFDGGKDEYTKLGTFEPEQCIAQILNVPTPIEYYRMPPPRGSNLIYEDPLAAPAAPAAEEDSGS